MHYWLVLPAAGRGRRFGAAVPKQYLSLAGRTVLDWALDPFARDARCAGRILALAADDARGRAFVAGRARELIAVEGGSERVRSVRAALRALETRATVTDWVLVHDAVRPCLARADLDRLLAAGSAHPVGAILAAPLADTLKRADGQGSAEATIERTGLWRALTPQMFRLGALVVALDAALAAGKLPTDEAQAFEWLGQRPLLVEGSPANLKITRAEDLAIAAACLAGQGAMP